MTNEKMSSKEKLKSFRKYALGVGGSIAAVAIPFVPKEYQKKIADTYNKLFDIRGYNELNPALLTVYSGMTEMMEGLASIVKLQDFGLSEVVAGAIGVYFIAEGSIRGCMGLNNHSAGSLLVEIPYFIGKNICNNVKDIREEHKNLKARKRTDDLFERWKREDLYRQISKKEYKQISKEDLVSLVSSIENYEVNIRTFYECRGVPRTRQLDEKNTLPGREVVNYIMKTITEKTLAPKEVGFNEIPFEVKEKEKDGKKSYELSAVGSPFGLNMFGDVIEYEILIKEK